MEGGKEGRKEGGRVSRDSARVQGGFCKWGWSMDGMLVSHVVALACLGQDEGALRVDLLVQMLGVKGSDESSDVEHTINALGRPAHILARA